MGIQKSESRSQNGICYKEYGNEIGSMTETALEKINRFIAPHKLIHFIGIGGTGMSAIARILLEKGYKISGTDLKESINTSRLKDFGAKIYYGHAEANVREAGLVVISSAIQSDNIELIAALNHKIPVFKRAEMLGFLMNQFQHKIAVAGTHGKTTTTSMITRIFDYCHKVPTYLIGGDMNDFGGNAALGKTDYFIAEADESDGSFLCLEPNIAVVTNIEEEHMNYYKTTQNLLAHFREFIEHVIARNGYVVLNQDNAYILEITKDLPREKVLFYSLKDPSSALYAHQLEFMEKGIRYSLKLHGKDAGIVSLKVFGQHNVANSLAAIGVGLKQELSLEDIKHGIAKFSGTKRRFQLIGEVNKIRIYDDYGHHPTEIMATLKGAKDSLGRRIICVFQPHRYSRTMDLLEHFAGAFQDADLVVITEIYSANEANPMNVSAQMIVDKMKDKKFKSVLFIEKKGEIAPVLMKELKSGDVVLTMGAGDIYTVGKELLVRLKKQYT